MVTLEAARMESSAAQSCANRPQNPVLSKIAGGLAKSKRPKRRRRFLQKSLNNSAIVQNSQPNSLPNSEVDSVSSQADHKAECFRYGEQSFNDIKFGFNVGKEPSNLKSTLDIYQNNMQVALRTQRNSLFAFDPATPSARRTFSTHQQLQKYNLKRIVAQTLIDRQYGFIFFQSQVARRQLALRITCKTYKSLAYAVVTEAYRKLQHFLMYMCDRKVKPVIHEEIRCIFTSLLHFRTYFDPPQAQTFAAFIRTTFNLAAATLSEHASSQLYVSLQLKLKQRILTKYSCPVFNHKLKLLRPALFNNKESQAIRKLQKNWQKRHEDEMVEFYRSDQHFANMRHYFKQIYPQKADCFSINSLKSQFFKLMRACLKHMAHLMHNKGLKSLPELIRLDGERIKIVIRAPGGQSIRLKLLDLRGKVIVETKALEQLIAMINQFIICKELGQPLRVAQAEPSEGKQSDCVFEQIIAAFGQDYTFDEYLLATGDEDCPQAGPVTN